MRSKVDEERIRGTCGFVEVGWTTPGCRALWPGSYSGTDTYENKMRNACSVVHWMKIAFAKEDSSCGMDEEGMKGRFPEGGVVGGEMGKMVRRSYGDGARSSSSPRLLFAAMGSLRGTPSRHGTIAAPAHGPPLLNDSSRAACRAKLRELGVFLLPRCVCYDIPSVRWCIPSHHQVVTAYSYSSLFSYRSRWCDGTIRFRVVAVARVSASLRVKIDCEMETRWEEHSQV